VARRIARAHGGDIYFTSEVIRRMPSPMAQTRFFVRIPRKQSLTSEHS
jgi:signal transduction histidine kinase